MRLESLAVLCCNTGENAEQLETGVMARRARRAGVMDKRGISAGYAGIPVIR